MKKPASLLALSALAVVGGLASCTKLTRGFDQNPNAATDAPATQQLTAAELSEGFIMGGEMARTTNIWSGVFHGAGNQYQALQSYITTSTDYDNVWSSIYQGTLAQLRLVETKSAANKQLLGIAQVTEAQMIGTTTALWGDVPYSTALSAGTSSAPIFPTYDAQKDVYASTQTLLSTAITNLSANAGAGATVTADVFYTGSQLRWIAAAHSLKARYYLHVKNYASAASEAKQGISSTSGDMLMPYPGGVIGTSANPYWDFNVNSRPGYMDAAGSYAPQLLQSRKNSATNESGRFAYFYTTAHTGVSTDLNTDNGAFQASSSFPLITYVETQAILAESLQRTGDAAGALVALNNIRAVDATIYTGGTYRAYTTADFATGGVANPASSGLSQNDALLKEILTEKYLSLIGQMEEFNDVRRTNNLIGVPKNVSTASSLPQRLLYPQIELNTNPNTPSPIPSLFTKTPVNQ